MGKMSVDLAYRLCYNNRKERVSEGGDKMIGPNLQFDETFFEGEEREGFYVDSIMKRAWASEMEILFEIDRICKKHGLRYFADSGTLLGAVRHKGFIPWDDDIDLTMPRADFEKFLEVAKDELPEGYLLQYRENTEARKEAFLCVRNSSVVSDGEEFLHRFHGCPWITGIDIFPLDLFPRDVEEHETLYLLLRLIYSCMIDSEVDKVEDKEARLAKLEELMHVSFERGEKLYGQLLEYFERVCKMYTDEECDDWIIYPIWIVGRAKPWKKEWFDETIYLPFENMMLPAPKGYDGVLRGWYGDDYMIPKKMCAAHGYPFYKKMQTDYIEYLRQQDVNLKIYEGLFYHLEDYKK